MTIKINVNGISFDLKFTKEVNKISIKTMPLAPKSIYFENSKWITEQINAVVNNIIRVFLLPYFSSIIGPNNKIKAKFPIKWSLLTCPSALENNRKYQEPLLKFHSGTRTKYSLNKPSWWLSK